LLAPADFAARDVPIASAVAVDSAFANVIAVIDPSIAIKINSRCNHITGFPAKGQIFTLKAFETLHGFSLCTVFENF
jgi:hypothetical protein